MTTEQMRQQVEAGLTETDRAIAAEQKRHKERMHSLKTARKAMEQNLAELDAMDRRASQSPAPAEAPREDEP